MYLKNLEISGFKSFADETLITFEPGITAIVGPNGCGKSNISDAIRWALGEQSPKHMRGARMDDFIFKGAAGRAGAGRAMVSVTISNEDGLIRSAPYSELTEARVTRKLFKTGESEYYINNHPSRLKDVVDLFLDTGVSTRSLSIIEQGQVTHIVNAKPSDRRRFIEEAAGVMRYKSRRGEALNKLALANRNLERLTDLMGELDRNRESARRQAGRARRYRSLKMELSAAALDFFLFERSELSASLDEAGGKIERMRDLERQVESDLASERARIETDSIEIARKEESLASRRAERYAIGERVEKIEGRARALSEKIETLDKNHAIDQSEIDQIRARIDSSSRARAEALERIERASARLDAIRSERASSLDRTRRARAEHDELAKRLEEARSIQRALSSELFDLKRADVERAERAARSDESIEIERGALSESIAQKERLESAIESARSLCASMSRGLQEAQERLDRANVELARLEREFDSARERSALSRDNFLTTRARANSVEELIESREGLSSTVKEMLDNGARAKIGGVLIDKAKPADQDSAPAFAAALNFYLEALIVDRLEDARDAIEWLKTDRKASAIFAPLDLTKKRPEPIELDESIVSDRSYLARMSEMTIFAPDAPASLRARFASIIVAKDLDGAARIFERASYPISVVTLDGIFISADGFIEGGEISRAPAAQIIERRDALERLKSELERDQALVDEAVESERSIEAELERARQSKESAIEESQRAQMEKYQADSTLARLNEDFARASEKIKSAELRLSEISTQRERDQDRRASIASTLAEKEVRLGEIESEIENLSGRLFNETRAQLDESISRLNEKEIEMTRLDSELEAARRERAGLDESLSAARATFDRLERRIELNRIDMAAARKEIQNARAELIDASGEKATIEDRLREDEADRQRALDAKHEKETRARALAERLSATRSQRGAEEAKVARLEERLDALERRADEEFDITVDQIREHRVDESLDRNQITHRLEETREKIAKIGAVNIEAIEEFEEIDKRLTFLKEQSADARASIETLNKTIKSLNRKMKHLFQEAFDEIAAHFAELAPRLFVGGSARMELIVDEDDPEAEPGVDLFARPAGKRLQNIDLLSAGEKALTAIALLFAIFKRKPSPFCLLDEVDAPLDEANIVRFRDLLLEMSSATQFIVITHNQKTMSFADRLYGVTQENEGVSKILSVDLNSNNGASAARLSASAEAPASLERV